MLSRLPVPLFSTLRFDFIDAAGQPAVRCFSQPQRVIVATRIDEVRPAVAEVQRAVAGGAHAAGYLAYEAAPAFDTALITQSGGDLPLVWFGIFDAPTADPSSSATADIPAVDWTPDVSYPDYAHAVGGLRRAILDGDHYQANYTFRLHARIDPSHTAALYARLRAEHRPPYAAFANLGRWQIASWSPELFFRVEGNRVTTRPMKGTAPRGPTPDADAMAAGRLAASAKDRAENVMIVDLMRNDLGRIAVPGSVRADRLFEVERYPTVFQMVSTVEAELRPGTTFDGILTALFPAGSVTGAPKASSMRHIAAAEASPRGIYCGAIGYLTPGGEAVFNVAIRTALIDTATGRATYGIGGGITWDSTAEAEHREALAKAACLAPGPRFSLLETMRLEHGHYVRRGRHLARLRASADYFDIPFDEQQIAGVLDAHADEHPASTRRARLLLSRAGRARVESEPLSPLGDEPLRVALARTSIDRQDRFLYHKTTHRALYDRHRADRMDVSDVLLWNEGAELTEFTIGNLVVELDGVRYTPPVASGLLAGVLRGELLERGELHERVLTREDLQRATAVFLVNSLRGWVRVAFAEAAFRDWVNWRVGDGFGEG